MLSGHVLHRAFEDERPGPLAFIINVDGADGRVGQGSAGSTRNQADFRAHLRATIKADLRIGQWPVSVDNLNTPPSASLGR
jgi:hypothetical protein